MSFNQHTLRSFINAEGKLIVCNEPFFHQFGCCTEHLIGKSVAEVMAQSADLLHAVYWCQSHPEDCCTVETALPCRGGSEQFRWMIYAERQQGKVAGIHLVGNHIMPKGTPE
jgi:hypothetical protein